jgi:hypothetical protein
VFGVTKSTTSLPESRPTVLIRSTGATNWITWYEFQNQTFDSWRYSPNAIAYKHIENRAQIIDSCKSSHAYPYPRSRESGHASISCLGPRAQSFVCTELHSIHIQETHLWKWTTLIPTNVISNFHIYEMHGFHVPMVDFTWKMGRSTSHAEWMSTPAKMWARLQNRPQQFTFGE